MNRLLPSLLVMALAACGGGTSRPTTTPFPIRTARPTPATVDVIYTLTGTATGADITYTDGAGNIQQQTGVAVPMGPKGHAGEGLRFTMQHGALAQFSAQNRSDSGNLDCAIKANGIGLNTGHASGGYAIVTCSALVP